MEFDRCSSAVRIYKRDDRDGSDCILHIIVIASKSEKKTSLPYDIILYVDRSRSAFCPTAAPRPRQVSACIRNE